MFRKIFRKLFYVGCYGKAFLATFKMVNKPICFLQCRQKTLRPNLILSRNRIKITYIIFYLLDNDTLILIVMAETSLPYIGFYLTFKYVFNETKTIPYVPN